MAGTAEKRSMATYGYARVSTRDQDPRLQLDALRSAGCDEVHEEKASGATRARPILSGLLQRLRAGDTVVVWRLDRLGRSTIDLLSIVKEIEDRDATLHSLGDAIDTSTASGRLMLTVLSAVAQMERERALERIEAGIATARQRPGYRHGRPPSLNAAQVDEAVAQRSAGIPQRTTARAMGVSRQALARSLAAADARRSGTIREDQG